MAIERNELLIYKVINKIKMTVKQEKTCKVILDIYIDFYIAQVWYKSFAISKKIIN